MPVVYNAKIPPEFFELVVLSFPGADRSIRMEDFKKGQAVSRRYRNRRIGEFLKELELAEGRSTGVPKILRAMRQNGSPAPIFESDEDRTWFLVRLPVHERARPEPSGQDTQQDTEHDTGQVKIPGKIPGKSPIMSSNWWRPSPER